MKTYLTILIPLLCIDVLWIGFIARKFYQKHLGYIMAKKFLFTPAVFFYLLYAFGILHFVVSPGLETNSPWSVGLRGVLFGLIAYSAYDLTNHATLSKWPRIVTIVDMVWGACVTGLVSTIAYIVITKLY
jgi:uncharacterized membrane protein